MSNILEELDNINIHTDHDAFCTSAENCEAKEDIKKAISSAREELLKRLCCMGNRVCNCKKPDLLKF